MGTETNIDWGFILLIIGLVLIVLFTGWALMGPLSNAITEFFKVDKK